MLPTRRDFDIFDEIFNDPFFHHAPRPPHLETKVMRTDVKEKDGNYEITIDLPGYDKNDIKIAVENGYLTVSASHEEEKKDEENGKYVRRERFSGECSRSFYIGEDVHDEDIKANFKNGTLKLDVPKHEEKEVSEKKYIQIED